MQRHMVEPARKDLHARLRGRRAEIEDAVRTRIFAARAPSEAFDPEYAEGLRAAVSAAIEYGLDSVELGEDRTAAPPPALLAQARLAAHSGVSLDTVMRRYVAGQALFSDFLVEEASGLEPAALQRLLRAQAALVDRLLAAVGEEYSRESEGRLLSNDQRNAKRVERLLTGERLDTSELQYDFDVQHLGVIAKGPGAAGAVRDLAAPLDCRLLLVHRKDGAVWAWLGRRRAIDPLALQRESANRSARVCLALGESAHGLGGWRLTHHQARAALPIAMRGSKSTIRYAEVPLLASIVQDELLTTSLRQLYLAPLERERDRGEVARKTLRAYFATDRNLSSAAAALGVSRRTVANRLRAIEANLGRPLAACTAEMDVSLRLHDLDRAGSPT